MVKNLYRHLNDIIGVTYLAPTNLNYNYNYGILRSFRLFSKVFSFYVHDYKISKSILLLSSLILVIIYGCLFSIYTYLCKSKIFNQYFNNIDSLDLLPFLPTIVTCDYRFSFFTVSFYGILYRVELLNKYFLRDNYFYRAISVTFHIMRRSSFFPLRLIGRVGGTGLGNIGFPGGNGPRLYAGVIVALGTVSIYQYRKYKVSQLNAAAQTERTKYETDAQTKRTKYETDAQTKRTKYETDVRSRQYDRSYDEYRKDKDAYDKRYPWWRGKPPTPPVPPAL